MIQTNKSVRPGRAALSLLSLLCCATACLLTPALAAEPGDTNDAQKQRAAKSGGRKTAAQRGSSKGKGSKNKAAEAKDSDEELDIALQAGLDRARAYYQSGDYPACVAAYSALSGKLDSPGDDIDAGAVEEARVHYAACLFAQDNKADAGRQLKQAIKDNPQMGSPDQVVFPEPFRDFFFRVRAEKLDEIEQDMKESLEEAKRQERARRAREAAERQRVVELERLAQMETLVHRNQRWIAAVPFGVGQFQNGDDTLGALFAVTELGLLATTIVAVSRQLSLHSQADGGGNVLDADAFNDPIQALHEVEVIAGAAFLVVTTAGIIEAQVNFVDEVPMGVRTRKGRPPKLPTAEPLQPQVGLLSDGAIVGVGGRF